MFGALCFLGLSTGSPVVRKCTEEWVMPFGEQGARWLPPVSGDFTVRGRLNFSNCRLSLPKLLDALEGSGPKSDSASKRADVK